MKLKTHWPTEAADGQRRLVSVSEIANLDCWRKYRWSREGLQPVRRFEALNFGIVWDAFIGEWWAPQPINVEKELGIKADSDQATIDAFGAFLRAAGPAGEPRRTSVLWHAYGRGGPAPTRFERAVIAANDAIEKEARRVDAALLERGIPRPPGWTEELDRMRQLVLAMGIHYVEHYGEEAAWECIASQVKFEVPFPSASGQRRSNRYWLHGVIDRVMFNRERNIIALVDDKTTAKAGPDYYDSFEYDLQLQLYSWAMRELGNPVHEVWLDVAAKLMPVFPEMRATPFDVLDEAGNKTYEEIPCGHCEGLGEVEEQGDLQTEVAPCAKCGGDGVEKYKTGDKAGMPKMRKVTRAGLQTMIASDGSLQYHTTYDLFLAALRMNNLDSMDYERERELLMDWDIGGKENPYFARPELLIDDAMMDEAADIMRTAAPYLDKLPDVPMRNRFRCKRCAFRVPCIERNEGARADLIAVEFTTRDQRKAHAIADAEAAKQHDDDPF